MDLHKACSLLGTSPSDDLDSAKKKYKKLVAKHHPDVDKSPNAENHFKQINQAWEIFEASKSQKPFDGFGSSASFRFTIPEPIHLSSTLSFKEAVEGTTKEFSFKRNRPCQNCGGQGKVPVPNNCKKCEGRGTIIQRHHNAVIQSTCPECLGRLNAMPCSPCSGAGLTEIESPLNVKIPPGIISGNTIRLQGQGNASSSPFGMQASDVFINLHVTPIPNLRIESESVVHDVNLTLLEAIKGKNISVPTIDGNKDISIPPKSKNLEEVLLPNLGIGRQYPQKVILHVDYPSDEQLSKLETLLGSP